MFLNILSLSTEHSAHCALLLNSCSLNDGIAAEKSELTEEHGCTTHHQTAVTNGPSDLHFSKLLLATLKG